ALIPLSRIMTAKKMPRRGLVPAPRRVPSRVADKDQPAWLGDPHHLVGHRPRGCDVFHDVVRHDYVGPAVSEGKALAATHNGGHPWTRAKSIGLEINSEITRTPFDKLAAELLLASTDIEHRAARQVLVPGDQRDCVVGNLGVEVLRVRLLDEKGPEQRNRPRYCPVSCVRSATHNGHRTYLLLRPSWLSGVGKN